ncbi:MAG: RNA polymerase sigma factor [Myxococcaceae bacterium]
MQAISEVNELPAARIRPDAVELYALHRDRVFHWALRYGAGDPAWAEDLMHDVFLKLVEQLDRGAPKDPGGWLYRVTANLSISRIRRERSFLARLGRLFQAREDDAPSPDEVLMERSEGNEALGMLKALPELERVALCMKVLDGRSQREIARALSLSEGYVSKLVTRAWQRVRDAGWEGADEP